jgi:predicted PurR-regulated permease PerM
VDANDQAVLDAGGSPPALDERAVPAASGTPADADRLPRRREHHGLWRDSLGRVAVRSAQALIVLALAAVVVLGMIQVKLVVIPVLIAVIVAAAVSPVVGALRRRGVPRAVAAWVALLTGIGAIGVVIWLVIRGFRREWPELASAAASGFDELERFLTSGGFGITSEQIEQARQAALDFLSSDTVSSGALAGATVAAEVVAGIFLGLVVLFFLLKDGEMIWDFLTKPLPAPSRTRAHRIGDRSVEVLGGYVRGTAVVALVDAVVIGVALAVLGVPLALPLATIVFLGAFIPLVGATVAGTLAALVALVANGPVTALIVVAVVILVNQLEGDLLAPVVLGRAVRLHALAILLALTAGTILAGIVGALLAVPLTAVAWTVVREWNGPVEDEAVPRPHLPRLPRRHHDEHPPAAPSPDRPGA